MPEPELRVFRPGGWSRVPLFRLARTVNRRRRVHRLAAGPPGARSGPGIKFPARVLGQQADRGFVSEVEEIASSGDKVMVAVHTPGADQRRAWQSEDRSYLGQQTR